MRFLSLALLPFLLAASPPLPPNHARDMAAGRELFTREVRQTLLTSCFKCHGGEKRRGGLDLSTRETMLKGGDNGQPLRAGDHKSSRLFRLASRLDEPHMPPRGHAPLGAKQLAALARWIDLGAPYDKPLAERHDTRPRTFSITAADRAFWSFRPLSRPAVPVVKSAWAGSPLDRFLLAAMETRGLSPSPVAPKRVQARRLYFGLTGLPPTPEQMQTFLDDTRPDAYERLAESLLASPALGEKWARHWLDVARFAESHGFEHDYDRPNAWPYRDFVVKAFNADLPFRDFARWQIAGDKIEPSNPLAITATGFLGAGVHSTQITANTVEKERYDELDDIVRTLGTAFLGLTVGCARCHNHKYDPVSQHDYYRLVATFTKTVRSAQELDLDPVAAALAREKRRADIERLEADLAKLEAGPLRERMKKWLASPASRSPWTVVVPVARTAGQSRLSPQADGSFLASGPNPARDTYTFTFDAPHEVRALRLEALAHSSMRRGGPGRASNGNFALSDVRVSVGGEVVRLIAARATFQQRGLPVAATIDRDRRSAWAVDPQFGKSHAAVFDLEKPLPAGTKWVVTLSFANNTGHNIGRPRLSVSADAKPKAETGTGLPDGLRAPGQEKAALAWFRTQDREWQALDARLRKLKAATSAAGKVKAMVCGEGLTPLRLHTQGGDFLEKTHFLNRGDPNQKGEVARPGFPEILHGGEMKSIGHPRVALADWLADRERGAGHLLARVIVNRLWQHHFGQGIVGTPSDFGNQGERPTHPALLEWLACELVESNWSLKHVHRLIITSNAYRQSSHIDPKKAALDPEVKLLWRRVPHRLEGEAIRDALLAVSGQLDRRMGGPGARDPRMERRSLYFFLKRSQLNPMMTLFDGTDGTVGIEQRATTTTAPQALLLLNSPIVREAARRFAARLAGKSDADAVRAGYLLAVGRPPSATETRETTAFLAQQRAAYLGSKQPAPDSLALADLCQVLLGLNEFVYVE